MIIVQNTLYIRVGLDIRYPVGSHRISGIRHRKHYPPQPYYIVLFLLEPYYHILILYTFTKAKKGLHVLTGYNFYAVENYSRNPWEPKKKSKSFLEMRNHFRWHLENQMSDRRRAIIYSGLWCTCSTVYGWDEYEYALKSCRSVKHVWYTAGVYVGPTGLHPIYITNYIL